MAVLTVRNLAETEIAALRVVAAKNGRSMEAEVRALIRSALPRGPVVVELKSQELPPVDLEIEARIERAQAKVRAMFGGELPKGRVDAFLADRREAAARGE